MYLYYVKKTFWHVEIIVCLCCIISYIYIFFVILYLEKMLKKKLIKNQIIFDRDLGVICMKKILRHSCQFGGRKYGLGLCLVSKNYCSEFIDTSVLNTFSFVNDKCRWGKGFVRFTDWFQWTNIFIHIHVYIFIFIYTFLLFIYFISHFFNIYYSFFNFFIHSYLW